VKESHYHLVLLICFAYNDKDYENLLDQYEFLTRTFTGWPLSDVKNMSVRERWNWIDRAKRNRRY